MKTRYILMIFSWVFSITFLVAQEEEKEVEPIYSENEVPEEYVDESEIFHTSTKNESCFLVRSKSKYGLEVNGKVILPMEYELKKNVNYNFFIFKKDEIEGIYDANSLKWLIELGTNKINYIANQFFISSNENNSTLLNSKGELLIENCKSIERIGENDFFIVSKKIKKDIQFGIFSANKKEFTLDFRYKDIIRVVNSGLVGVKKKKGYSLYDPFNDKWSKNKYDSLSGCGFSPEPRVIVELNGLYGVIDKQENLIIPINYLEVKELNVLREVVLLATTQSKEIDVYQIDGSLVLNQIDTIEPNAAHKLIISEKEKFGLCEIKNDSLIIIAQPVYDEVKSIYKASVLKEGELYKLICDGGTDYDSELLFTKVQGTVHGKILVTQQDGFVSLFNANECKIGKQSEFTSVEEVDKMYKGWRKYRAYSYFKAKKGESQYYLLNSSLYLESQRTFHEIIKSQISYIFYENKDGKIGVYDALSDIDVLDPIYDSVEFYGAEVYLFKDGKKGNFSKGKIIME